MKDEIKEIIKNNLSLEISERSVNDVLIKLIFDGQQIGDTFQIYGRQGPGDTVYLSVYKK